jgi:N-acetyl-1-D-myo-inositol-2-amino-2-deoxy-alpha-D-glucopyranoside deacetylase
LALLSSTLAAQPAPTVEELVRPAEYGSAEPSRNGRYLATTIVVNGRRNLAVVELESMTRVTLTDYADFDVVVGQLAAVIGDLRPHVVVTYDPGGGYGHPDHIQAHRVTTAAVSAAADRWQVPKSYWTVTSATEFRAGINSLGTDDVLPEWIWLPDDVSYGFADDQITAVIDAPEHVAAKVAAISAHATQVELGPTGRAFTLSNRMILPVLSREHYVLVSGRPGELDARGWENDLLAGIDLAAG